MSELLLSTAVVFVAELGDKSQLLALAFAARYRIRTVLLGITAATAAVHLGSVALGRLLGMQLPDRELNAVAGAAFLAFAMWTLRGDALSSADEARSRRSGRGAFLAVAAAFALAELGDKTMLATVTLATTHGWLQTWVGSTIGMVGADALAMAMGVVLGRRLQDRVIRVAAAALFVAFGAALLLQAATG